MAIILFAETEEKELWEKLTQNNLDFHYYNLTDLLTNFIQTCDIAQRHCIEKHVNYAYTISVLNDLIFYYKENPLQLKLVNTHEILKNQETS